jgi:hypothetical protein
VDGRQDPAFLEGDATTRALMMTDEVGDKVGFPHEQSRRAFHIYLMPASAFQKS